MASASIPTPAPGVFVESKLGEKHYKVLPCIIGDLETIGRSVVGDVKFVYGIDDVLFLFSNNACLFRELLYQLAVSYYEAPALSYYGGGNLVVILFLLNY